MSELQPLLARLPGLRGAAVVQQLTDGPLADKWQLSAAGRLYSLRVDRPAARAIGLDRRAELAVLEALAGAGWCNAPVHADPDAGVLVLPWATGEVLPARAFDEPRYLQQLAALLQALHSSVAELPPFRLAERNAAYAAAADTPEIRQQAVEVSALLADVQAELGAGCPCHNDPVAGNVLQGREWRFIDFEYAGAGNSHFDLAAVIEYHGLDAGRRAALLEGYLAAGGAADREILGIWRRIYRLTAANWAAATAAVAG